MNKAGKNIFLKKIKILLICNKKGPGCLER